MFNSIRKIWPVTIAAAIALAPSAAIACAMCGLPPGDHQSHAFNTSVLFMMAAPYTIFALGVGGFYIAYRSSRTRRDDKEGGASGGPDTPRHRQ